RDVSHREHGGTTTEGTRGYGSLALAQPSTLVSLQPLSPYVSFKKQQRLALASDNSCRAGSQRGGRLSSARSGTAPKAHRHHHGRQRTLGAPPPSAARCRTPGRSGVGTVDGRNGGAHRHSFAHALCLFGRELEEASSQRSRFPDG